MKLYIITGLPGAGKTTLAEKLKREGKIKAYFEADQFMVNERGEYSFDRNKLDYCHNQCFLHTENCLDAGQSVAVSNTSMTKKEVRRYIEAAKSRNIPIEIIHLTTEYGTIHNVPQDKIEEMRKKREFFTVEDF
jgi:predicted kinase